MKVALLALHFSEYTSRLALALSERHEVLLILNRLNAARELSPTLATELERRVDVRYLPHPRRLLQPFVAWQAFRFVHRFSPDVLHMQEVPSWSTAWVARMLRRIPMVLTVHDPEPHSGRDAAAVARWQASLGVVRRMARRIIVHGQALRSSWRTEWAPREVVRDVPHGVLAVPDCAIPAFSAERASFLFFGRVHAYKGLDVLVEAARRLHREGCSFRLTVAGEGPELERHRSAIASLPCVELLDRRIPPEDVSRLFLRNAVVVLPYKDATQSGVAAIALVHGRPVIATKVGALPEVVIDGRTGLLVPPCDAEQLAAAMKAFVDNPALYAELSAGAAEFAQQTLSWSAIAQRTAAVYSEVVDVAANV